MFDLNGQPLYVVYAHILKATNEFYIGKTVMGMQARWREHIHDAFKRSESIRPTSQEIIRLYGYSDDVWKHVHLYVSFKRDDKHLLEVENDMICHHKSIINGFNMISETHKIPYRRFTKAHELMKRTNIIEYEKLNRTIKKTRLDKAINSFEDYEPNKMKTLEEALKDFVPAVRKETRKERFKRMGIIT